MKITVTNHISLDGVMQAPAAADEDTAGGFAYGGWAAADNDEVLGRKMGEGMSGGPGVLLFGRRTYEHMSHAWRGRTDNPFTELLDRSTKYVASRTLTEPLEWENSVLLQGDVAAAVAELKQREQRDAVVLGSAEFVQTLRDADLVDQYVLIIHPIVLGSGKRLFPDGGTMARFRLVENLTTTKDVIIATYSRERARTVRKARRLR